MRKSDSSAKLAHFTHNRFLSRRLWLIFSAASVTLLVLRAFIFAGAVQRCEIPRIIHQTWKNDLVSYTAAQRILLVGEGDFSFSSALCEGELHGSACNLVASALDTEEQDRLDGWAGSHA